jgi:hypothetical protein
MTNAHWKKWDKYLEQPCGFLSSNTNFVAWRITDIEQDDGYAFKHFNRSSRFSTS